MISRAGQAKAIRARRSRLPVLEPMEFRTLLSTGPGNLDPSFGYQGVVPLPFATTDVVSYPDGRFLLSGTAGVSEEPYVQRYSADGQLDPTFGALGTVVANFTWGANVALEPDGKIVESATSPAGAAQLIRYNPDGSLDATFGTSGATAPISLNVAGQMSPLTLRFGSLGVLPDGRILLAGEGAGGVGLVMVRTDGTLDPSFHGNGTLVVTPGPSPYFTGLAVEDGKILLQIKDATSQGAAIFVYRFNVDGSADTTFGSSGVINLHYGQNASLAVQPDGKFIIGYAANQAETISRYNADGSPDQLFGTGGSTTFGNDFNYLGGEGLSDIALQPNGKILISNFTSQTELYRLNSDGTIDASFGTNGVVNVALPQPIQSAYPNFITVQPSGRIILAFGGTGTGPFELAGIVGDPVVAFGDATSVSSSSGTPTAVYDVSETAGSATITLVRGGDLSQTLSVPFSTDDSGGRAGINYTPVHTTVTFAAGSETATVAIPILDDPNASLPIDVPLRLGTPSNGAILGSVAIGELRIVPVEGIVITPVQLSSVMQGSASSSFTVALQSVPSADVTVPLSISSTNPGAALSISTADFTPADALTPKTVTVTATGGSGSSAVIATISAGPATSADPKYNGLSGTATVAVYPSTSGPGWIEFGAANFTYDENAGTAKITVVRLGGSSGSVSVDFATSDGSDAAAGKYVPLSGSISFGAGVTSKAITITLNDPGHNLQGDQTVDLTLSNPTGGAQLGVFPTATLTLHDTSQPVGGDLDRTFGTDGKSILPDYLAGLSTITRQSNGDLVMAGTGGVSLDGANLVRVWRTNSSGQPDLSFGQQGLALIPFPNFTQVKSVAIAPDGKIVVVGTATKPAGGSEFALLRLNMDGTLDTGFGQNGLVTSSLSAGNDQPSSVSIEADESILVGGTLDTASDADRPFAFVHYFADGSLDIGFGAGGALVIPAASGGASATIQQPDGKWLLIGGGGYDPNSDGVKPGFALRLNPDFTPDSTFGVGGVASLNFTEYYFCATLQPDGKILIGGGAGPNGGSAASVARLKSDGSPDTAFGSGGSVRTSFGDGLTSAATAVFVEPDGNIVASGYAVNAGFAGGYLIAVAGYLSDGSPDSSFAEGGSRAFSIGGDGNDFNVGAVARPDGDIVIASTSDSYPVLAAILPSHQKKPTITWANPAGIVYGTPLGPTQLDATANVRGTFAYSPPAGTILHAGNNQPLSVTFTPTDTTDYTTATDKVYINVAKATPTITWANPADIVYGVPLSGTQLDATSSWTVGGVLGSVAGTFTYTPPAGTILHAGNNQSLSVAFTPTDATDYTTASDTVYINVAKATPTITWANPADIVYGTPLGPAQLGATANVPGTFVYSPPDGVFLHAGPNQLLSVTFTPADTADYTTASATTMISVSKATPTITWARPADIVVGTPLGAAQLDATASVPGTFIYAPPAGAILSAGSNQILAVSFAPADATDYSTATASVFINVNSGHPPALPVIIGEHPLFTPRFNRHHKPVGQPILSGFEFDFSEEMNPATAGAATNYQVDWISTRRVRKQTVQVLHAVPVTVQYSSTTNSVSVLLSGKQAFAQGGQITVIAEPPNGVSSEGGVLLDGGDKGEAADNGVFRILPRGRGITRG
jgi:uncharacterized delta-60 repeat protein